jgi:hypothetical protein
MPGPAALRNILRLGLIAAALPGYGEIKADATQAEAMLQLLEQCKAGTAPELALERVIALPGTQLIIRQQNISRRITPQQYETVLQSACRGEVAHVEPSEPGARAEKGAQGLMEDVAPALIWGREHIPALQKRLEIATRNRDLKRAVPIALENLPEKVALAPKFYFVMGGRAGAAALDEGIYIDLLCDAWRARDHPMTSPEMVEFFAHEAHHTGYDRILERKRERLHLTESQTRAWNFLVNVLMEGSATLLINAHGSWAELERIGHIQPDLARLPELLPKAQNVLRESLDGAMTDQQYEVAVSEFFGEGYHATGARLLFVIQEAKGKAAVFRVMDDPRILPAVYNECAGSETFRFNPRLAERLEKLGETR